MNTINTNDQNFQDALNVLGKSFHEYKNNSAKTEEQIKDNQHKIKEELSELKNNMKKHVNLEIKSINETHPSTWGNNNSNVVNQFGDYVRTGKSTETKSANQEDMGGYVCIPNLNQYLLEQTSYLSPVRAFSSTYKVSKGNSFELMFMDSFNVQEQSIDHEYDNENSTTVSFQKHLIEMHAIEACANITQDMMCQPRPLNFNEFVIAKVANDISKKERQLFVDGVENKIDSIIPSDDKYIVRGKFGYEAAMQMVSKLPEELHDNAKWLMTRSMYNEFLKLNDNAGRPLIRIDSNHHSFLNYPIHFMPELEGKECKLIFCNLNSGYAIAEHEHLFALHDKYSRKPLIQNYVRKHIGSKVIRPDAFVGFIDSKESGKE
ncbi:phage major capsid protein [Candidatus Cytomitobacter primus]|uniref:Phage major capsid protein n=1 Tax=Candidatus Cytomitobacter primus TaxID=2066024 RepID=A0A5C0UEK2_9PROT|nr:phage major capsid protein [Candidatus Cytomitobacter primus]QEK38525.1 phage major capsid protein [Candidatus Cytomitobacter primus]